jgi:glycine/D-amino acid oxidase-like deaminating enzyme
VSGAPPALDASFWSDALETRELQPALRGPLDADVALVGGGYTSLSAALHLKRQRPDLEVAVLESRHAGFGASGRNAGMVLAEAHLDRVRDMGAGSVRFTWEAVSSMVDAIADLAEAEGFDCELERTGYLEMALHPVHLRRARATAAACAELGVELGMLDASQSRERIASRRFAGALVHPRGALLHPGRYLAGLRRAVLRRGVRLFESTPVRALRPGREVELTTPEGRVRARHVILGLNAYLPASGLSPIRDRAVTLHSFILLTEPLPPPLREGLAWAGREGWSDMRRLHNYVRLVGERLLFGGRVVYHFGLDAPEATAAIYARLHAELRRTFPALAEVPVERRWAGPVSISPRRSPVIGSAGRSGNLHYALGYSGMGVSLASLAGRVLADAVLGEGRRWDELVYRRDRPWPLPPEPWRFLGFQGSFLGMRLADAWDARRG